VVVVTTVAANHIGRIRAGDVCDEDKREMDVDLNECGDSQRSEHGDEMLTVLHHLETTLINNEKQVVC
jgi:hypothetical protein